MNRFPGKANVARLIVLLAASMFLLSGARAQDRQLVLDGSQPTTNSKRIALVIGNGAYASAPPLKNPPNDARDMAATLKTLGFDVMSGVNLNQRDMKRLIREFGLKLKNGGSGLFYYAGHGVQSKGRNYLIPVDANIQSEAEVEDSGVDAALVLNFMDDAQNGLNIVILDACRNNPFARSFRSATDGLAQIDAPTGTLIAYATAPGRVASDGAGQNGLYTSELLKQMQTPGVSITDVFMRVRAEVMKQTGNKQVPWEASSLVGSFYFAGASANSNPVTTAKIDPVAFELSYWETIKSSANADDFKAYLARYPQGQFVELAKNRIANLSTPSKPADTSPLAGSAGATELAFWDSIKNSTTADDYHAYLEKYPKGEFAGLARRRLAPLEAKEKETASTEAAAIDPLTGTKWSGDSSGGDKHYEFQFLPNAEVIWSLKWARLNNPTYHGTYTRSGNDLHMMFPEGKPFFGGNVEATLSGSTLTGSWNFGRDEARPDSGMYKFTVAKASSTSGSAPVNVAASLEGTTWKGDSDGGDKHYEFQFLPNGQVVEYLKMHESLTNKGTWYVNGNTIHMEFPDYYPVEALIEGNRMTGSWKSGTYKFTIFKIESGSAQPQTGPANPLEGTTWKGDSASGDKHYEFQFLANGEVQWALRWNGNKSYKGTWRQAGNTITMDFHPWWTDPVVINITGDQMNGTWAKGQYKFTLARVR
jgi:hypothetical protein